MKSMTSNPTSEGPVEREAERLYVNFWARNGMTDPVLFASQAHAIRNMWIDIAEDTSEALVTSLRNQLEGAKEALRPFALIAGPIKGEEGRPTYLDAIMKGETEELAVTTIFDTGGRGAVLWADDFRLAASTLYGLEKIDVSSVSQSAATGPVARIAPEAEPSAAVRP